MRVGDVATIRRPVTGHGLILLRLWQDRVLADDGTAYDGKWKDVNGDGTDDAGDQHAPIVFTRGRLLIYRPSVEFSKAIENSKVWVRAALEPTTKFNGDDFSLTFAEQQISRLTPNTFSTADDGEFLFTEDELPDFTGQSRDFRLKWEISTDERANWKTAGVSSNRLYVTWHKDVVTTVYETALNIGTRAAKGMGDESSKEQVLDKVWEAFASLRLQRISDELAGNSRYLTYFENYRTAAATAEDLMKTGDGQCTSWSYFFANVLDAICNYSLDRHKDIRTVLPESPTSRYTGFFVRTWDFNGYLEAHFTAPKAYLNDHSYNWTSQEGTFFGCDAQGHSNPATIFTYHVLAKIGTRWFDPSFGKVYESLHDFQRRAICGFFNAEESADGAQLYFTVSPTEFLGDELKLFDTDT